MTRLTSEAAARIAKAAGLGVPDAAALMQLTDSEAEAEAIAQQFAATMSPDELAAAVERKLGKR